MTKWIHYTYRISTRFCVVLCCAAVVRVSARCAFPAVSELQDKQLQEVLQRQLRLYTTGTCGGRAWGQIRFRGDRGCSSAQSHSCRCSETGWASGGRVQAVHGAAICL
jgi:hypothetical protein